MTDATAASVLDAFNAAWNTHDLDAALTLVTDDCVFESTGPAPDGQRYQGKEAIRAAWNPIFDNPRSHFEVEEGFSAGDRFVQRWRYSWGEGHLRGVDVITLAGGKVAAKLSYVKG